MSLRDSRFEGQDALVLDNGKLEVTVLPQGGVMASVVMTDDADHLNPLWNPLRLAREAGRQASYDGTLGHFVCVDGFGQPSAQERAAGLPMHGEAHTLRFTVQREPQTVVMFSATLPIVQEVFSRTFTMVNGENVIYVDSTLESLLGFDRPVAWAEHATVDAPFLAPGKTRIFLSGSRSQNRDYRTNQQAGRGAPSPMQRRLAPGEDFTWPMARGRDGQLIDLSAIPDDPHYLDHAATLLDPARQVEWVAVLNTEKKAVYGYLFRRGDYPWIQHWGNYPSIAGLVRGFEFATQPYDVPRREAISMGSMFATPTYRWLPAKSKIESHFMAFYAHTPEGFETVDEIRWDGEKITLEDHTSGGSVALRASRGLEIGNSR